MTASLSFIGRDAFSLIILLIVACGRPGGSVYEAKNGGSDVERRSTECSVCFESLTAPEQLSQVTSWAEGRNGLSIRLETVRCRDRDFVRVMAEDELSGLSFVFVPGRGGGCGVPEHRAPHAAGRLNSFMLARTELTLRQSRRRGGPGCEDLLDDGTDDDRPVESPDEDELEALAARVQCDFPSVSEWEYALTYGSDGLRWYWGNDDSRWPEFAAIMELRDSEWEVVRDANGRPIRKESRKSSPVARLGPSPLGLFDMIGNVWEITSDVVREPGPVFRRVSVGGDYSEQVTRSIPPRRFTELHGGSEAPGGVRFVIRAPWLWRIVTKSDRR